MNREWALDMCQTNDPKALMLPHNYHSGVEDLLNDVVCGNLVKLLNILNALTLLEALNESAVDVQSSLRRYKRDSYSQSIRQMLE